MKYLLLLPLCLAAYLLPAQKPELVLPAIHSSPVLQFCFSADHRFMASCAGTKEIKLWEQKTGRLIRTVATPLPIECMALSGDGGKLVCGTYCGVSEYSEDEGAKPNINTEVQVWDMLSGQPLRTLKVLGKPMRIHQVEISGDGNRALAVFDGQVTLWDARTGTEKWQTKRGEARFSADGAHVLLVQGCALSWVDATTGAQTPILKDACITTVCGANEVVILTSAGSIKRWDPRTATLAPDSVALPEGLDLRIARFSQDGSQLGVLANDTDGEQQMWFKNFDTKTGKLVGKQAKVESRDGEQFKTLTPDLQYYVSTPLVDVMEVQAGMSAYSISTGRFSHYFGLKSLEVTTNANIFRPGVQIYNQGRMILIRRDTTPMDLYNTLFLPERGEIICGVEEDSLQFFAKNQALLPDNRWRVACNDHLSYQISDAKSGQLVATLLLADVWPESSETGYTDAVSRVWAVTTPSGLFDASPEMMNKLHYVLGMEVIELEQLKERYYEPGLLMKIMGLASGELRKVEQFKDVALYPKIEAKIEQNQLIINLIPQNGGIGKLSLFVNDKEVAEDINPQRRVTLSLDLKAYEKYYRSDTLNVISLRAYNAEGWLKSPAYRIDYTYVRAKGQGSTGGTTTLGDAKPRLFALVVGTADYSGEKLDLQYPDQDAAAIASAIGAAGKELFGEGVQLQLFTTGKLGGNAPPANQISSKTNLQKAFESLAGQAQATDILLLYFSGHGITYGEAEKAQFYYLTKDIASEDLSDPEVRANFTISSIELTDWIKKIPALKQVLILDACSSGKIVESLAAIGQKDLNPSQVRALDRMKDRTGMFILTGSADNKVSYEAGQYGQGLLTYSLLEGMSGLALSPDKRVDVMTLFQYARDKVPEMAKSINGIQTPILAFPTNGGSFDIGIVNKNVKIPLAQVKPVFIRNNFQDEETLDDVLGLTEALEQNFRTMTARGGQSRLLYVDVQEYENAYSMKGRYQVTGNAVELRVRLFKGKTLVGAEFQVSGTKDDVPGLVQSILEQVMGMLK